MTAAVRVSRDFYALRIHIGEAMHVHIPIDKLIGMQSWCDDESNHSIEYVLKGGTMRTEYSDREMWNLVLDGLERVL